jgi:hypothetical protein
MGKINKPKKGKGLGVNGNLIPITDRTPEERAAMGRKGALSYSPKRSIAAKIRWLRDKGLTDENAKHLTEVLSDPDLSALDNRIYLERIKKQATGVKEMNILAKNFLDWHKSHHGIKNINQNLNLNISLEAEKERSELEEYLKNLK